MQKTHRALSPFASIILTCLLLTIFSAAQSTSAAPGAIPTQIPGQDALLMGTAWYPEQWPESRWEEDLTLMEAANLKVVRVGEFAWSKLEPSEGRYDLDWLERAIALAAKHHIVTVLGTPTATPPAWLTQKYPDVLRVQENGRRETHGNRAHASVSSARYRLLCRQIAERMAARFGQNPNVVGWQIDNEYGYALMSYDGTSKQYFQDWLKSKYQTLDNLNAQWTTNYWSETYDSWSEIPIPIGGHNPGLRLDWKHFVTSEWAEYQQNQINVIRRHAEPRQFITGNFMGFFDGFDHYSITEPLTFASWDDYVGKGHLDPDQNGLSHDLTRGFKRQNFWIMETQPGMVNWAPLNNFLNRGEGRAMAWQAIAHGADDVNYWQWRSALNGQEQYHGTLLGADGTPVPFYDEVSQTAHEFGKVQSAFEGTTVVSQVALLYSYDSHWAIQFQKHNDAYNDNEILKSYYSNLRRLSQSVDVVSAYAPLDSYKLVVAPSLNVIPEDLAKHLIDYVNKGGHLVLGPRSGMKDQFNSLLKQRQPGFLVEPLGGRVEQYYALEKDVRVSGTWGEGQASIWAEQLKSFSSNPDTFLKYGKSNGWLDDQPAVITHAFGKGRITYIGAVLDEKLMDSAAHWMIQQSNVTPAFGPVPEGVEASRRTTQDHNVYILINFAKDSRTVSLPHSMKTLLHPAQAATVDLPPYGVEILVDSK